MKNLRSKHEKEVEKLKEEKAKEINEMQGKINEKIA